MKYQLVIDIFVITTTVVCKGYDDLCADSLPKYYKDHNAAYLNDLQRVVDKLIQDIDREVGSGCFPDRLFEEKIGYVKGDLATAGGCWTSDDLKKNLFKASKYMQNSRNVCGNYKIFTRGEDFSYEYTRITFI